MIETHKGSKDKLSKDREMLDSDIEETCWAIQQKHGAKFSEALTGYRGSKKTFRDKCLQEYPNMDEKNPPALKDIEPLYSVAFGEAREAYSFYKGIDTTALLKNEECTLLGKRISGSSETPVGKFIEFLQNSDWVKQGIGYAGKSEGKCPYCQQTLPAIVQQDIEAFFDETYEKECTLVRDFQRQYEALTNALLSQLKNISDNPVLLLDYELFKSEVKVLSAVIDANKKVLQDKTASPATIVNIDSVDPIVQRINTIIIGFNTDIKRNNDIVQNQAQEKKHCQKLLWQYFTYELRTSIQQYQKDYNGKTSGIRALADRIKEQSDKEQVHKRLIAEKEETLTSVVPTVNAINVILKRFGFDGFTLTENSDEKGTYKIIRPDGSNAKKTLSEGEYNFITFLYFYHLVYGSQDKTGIATDKVVVIDDPISSLDSNVLFIISTLVRTILKDCKDGNNGIKQIFILTHNVYFHKEVSFLGKVAVITGAGRGIGKAIAIAYAEAGANIVCAARTAAEIEETVNEISRLGERALAVKTDVTCIESVNNMFERAVEYFGGIDILVINAGANYDRETVENSNLENWKRTLDVNLFGAYYCAHSAIPFLKQRGAGKIITIGSGLGHRGYAGGAAYSCSKAGLWMLTRVLAQELLQYKISVNELIPGPVQTSIDDNAKTGNSNVKSMESEWQKQPEDVIPLALFLASQPDIGPTAQSFSLMRRDN